MKFDGDAFISYAHLDNVGLSEGHKGWVANLRRALEVRVAQLLGKRSRIWWDPKLQGNDVLRRHTDEQLQRVARWCPSISPRYDQVGMVPERADGVLQGRAEQGGVRLEDKSRIFKVLKTPVPLELHPPELQPLLGYEFFKVDPSTGRFRELDEIFGPEAEKDFWLKLDDLAHDMCGLLEMLDNPQPTAGAPDDAVYLAETTSDLREQREAIKRDLQQHGHTVLPTRALPPSASEVTAAMREDLAHCRMSIHMIGRTYSLVPEGADASLLEIQNGLAIERARHGRFTRLVWIPSGLQVDDQRQRKVIDDIRMDQRIEKGADLLETTLEDLHTVVGSLLLRDPKPLERPAVTPTTTGTSPQVYLMHDSRDADVVTPWVDFLFKDFEVIHPIFTGDEAEMREYHEENLRTCDGALIFYGAGQRSAGCGASCANCRRAPGYGRTKPHAARGDLPDRAEDARERALPHARSDRHPAVGRVRRPIAAAIHLAPESQAARHSRVTEPGTLLNPFPGLRPFEPDEDHLFFGREKETDELLRRLRYDAVPGGRRHVGQRQVVAGPLRADPVAAQRLHGERRLELARRDLAARRRSDRPPGRGARRPGVIGATDDELATHEPRAARSDAAARHPGTCRRRAAGAHPARTTTCSSLVDQFEELFRFRRSRQIEQLAATRPSRSSSCCWKRRSRTRFRSTSCSPCAPISSATAWSIRACPKRVNEGQYLVPRMTRDELRSGDYRTGGGRRSRRSRRGSSSGCSTTSATIRTSSRFCSTR